MPTRPAQHPHLLLPRRLLWASLVAIAAALTPRGTDAADTPSTSPSDAAHTAADHSVPAIPGLPVDAPAAVPASAATDAAPAGHEAPMLLARPTGPQVQPCRHLPPAQMIECVQRSGAAAPDGATPTR
jgi:hypothetical protein